MRFQPISFTVNLNNGICNYYENSVFVHPRLDKRKQILSAHAEPLFLCLGRTHCSQCLQQYVFNILGLLCFLILFCSCSSFIFHHLLSWFGLIIQHVGTVSTEGEANKTLLYKESVTKCVYKLLTLRWTGERHYISVKYYYLSKSS